MQDVRIFLSNSMCQSDKEGQQVPTPPLAYLPDPNTGVLQFTLQGSARIKQYNHNIMPSFAKPLCKHNELLLCTTQVESTNEKANLHGLRILLPSKTQVG